VPEGDNKAIAYGPDDSINCTNNRLAKLQVRGEGEQDYDHQAKILNLTRKRCDSYRRVKIRKRPIAKMSDIRTRPVFLISDTSS
jgi:hypothetical protein